MFLLFLFLAKSKLFYTQLIYTCMYHCIIKNIYMKSTNLTFRVKWRNALAYPYIEFHTQTLTTNSTDSYVSGRM